MFLSFMSLIFKWRRLLFILISFEFILLSFFYVFCFVLLGIYIYYFICFCVITSLFGLVMMVVGMSLYGRDRCFFWKFSLSLKRKIFNLVIPVGNFQLMVFFFVVLMAFFMVFVLYLSIFFLRVKSGRVFKRFSFERGFMRVGKVQNSFSIHFFVIMLVFVVFDLEVVLLLGVVVSDMRVL